MVVQDQDNLVAYKLSTINHLTFSLHFANNQVVAKDVSACNEIEETEEIVSNRVEV